MLEKKTPFHRLPTAQKCCKKQYKIQILVWGDEKVHSCPQANQNTKFAKQNQKKNKKKILGRGAHSSEIP